MLWSFICALLYWNIEMFVWGLHAFTFLNKIVLRNVTPRLIELFVFFYVILKQNILPIPSTVTRTTLSHLLFRHHCHWFPLLIIASTTIVTYLAYVACDNSVRSVTWSTLVLHWWPYKISNHVKYNEMINMLLQNSSLKIIPKNHRNIL